MSNFRRVTVTVPAAVLKAADLDKGDLRFHTDFRSIYATVLNKWLKVDSKLVLGTGFKEIGVLGLSTSHRNYARP